MAYDRSIVTINSVLEANFAGGGGGGLASADESIILIKNGALFRKNYALGNGGGVLAAGLRATIGDSKSHAPYFAYLFSRPTLHSWCNTCMLHSHTCCIAIHDQHR
jgi:predicted outer membrane repeat protein